jgi:glycosyltransferase involved in cell wall biosynthesis
MKTKNNIKMNTSKTAPLVSVIMPVYNAELYIQMAIDSILGQTYKNFELIIVNDASTDSSWNIITKYAKKYPKKVKAFNIEKCTNAAGNGATNYGLQFAKGKYIARMDADDVSHPQRLEKQVAYFESHPKTILCGTQAYAIDKDGKIFGEKTEPLTHAEIYDAYGVIHPVIHPSVMIQRSLLPNKNKMYEMKWNINDDYYTFFRLLGLGEFANLPEKLLYYRIHGKNLSLANPKQKFYNSVHIRLEAVKEFGYKMSVRSWILLVSQVILISFLPEQGIVPAYLLLRGIKRSLHAFKRTGSTPAAVEPAIA